MHLRLLFVAALMVSGCHSSGTGGAGAHGATSSSATSGSTAVATAPTPSASTAKQAPAAAPAPTGDPSKLALASGATLAIPAGATAKTMAKASSRLPGVVKAAHKYELGSAKRLLLVNEMDREGLACDAVLDRELDRANKAKADTDPQKQAMRKMKGITEIKVGGHRALYAVSQNRAPTPGSAEADTSKPMLGVTTLIMCRNKDYVVMMHAADQSVSAEDTKKILVSIAASYTPAG